MPARVPDVAEVERIAALAEPVRRNIAITQCYSDLAHACAERCGSGANWCAFATWASRQAGTTIRGEDLRNALVRAIREWVPAPAVSDALLQALRGIGADATVDDIRRRVADTLDIDAVAARSADAVARGNLKVFAEIGHAFARFLSIRDDAAFAAFLATLREGGPPDGQRLLTQAFRRYRAVTATTDARTRAEQLLLANLEVGLHEQTRLQPEIAEALNAALPPADQLVAHLLRTLLPWGGWWARVRVASLRRLGMRPPLDVLAERLLADLGDVVRKEITRHLMTLELGPDTIVRLGHDLNASFPASLTTPADPELRAFLAQVDRTPDSVHGTGARDWADLRQRMHFIADLFRCYHESDALFSPPFR